MSPGVTLETLIKYYQMGYNAVRRYTSSAYVILCNRLGPANSKELLPFARSLSNVVIEVHYYNLYSDSYKKMNVHQNIDFIYNQRFSDLQAITIPAGPLSFVGKFSFGLSLIPRVYCLHYIDAHLTKTFYVNAFWSMYS